ncbi:MAG: site-specific integrase [Bacteroidetes bacterium]|nr:site-specific integrase [Bacteroidota bacterium]
MIINNSTIVPVSLPAGELKKKAEEILDLIDADENTRKDYKSRIGMFLEYLGGKEITPDTFLHFKRHLEKRIDIKLSTKNKYLAVARIFLRELFKRGLIPTDITANIKGFKQGKRHKKFGISPDEAMVIHKHLLSLPINKENSRLKVLFCLLAIQGLREIEISRLEIGDIDLIHSIAYILGKGQEDKDKIHLHPFTVHATKEYLQLHKLKDGVLILSYSFSNFNKGISTRGIRFVVGNMLKELAIRKSTHGFRHFFTTELIKAYNGNLLTVANFTRHKSLEMLQTYNDDIEMEKQLPNYYQTFSSFKIT